MDDHQKHLAAADYKPNRSPSRREKRWPHSCCKTGNIVCSRHAMRCQQSPTRSSPKLYDCSFNDAPWIARVVWRITARFFGTFITYVSWFQNYYYTAGICINWKRSFSKSKLCTAYFKCIYLIVKVEKSKTKQTCSPALISTFWHIANETGSAVNSQSTETNQSKIIQFF